MSRRGLTLLIAGGLVVVLGVLAAVLPVPYVVLQPGPPTDTLGKLGTATVVTVTGARTYPTTGHLFLTTVVVEPASCSSHPTLAQAIHAWLDQYEAVQPTQAICPPGQSNKAVQQQNANDMSQSQHDATTAALLYLGYKPVSEQVIVGGVDSSVPAASVLQVGDAILAVDGTTVTDQTQLRALIGKHSAGSGIGLTIERNGKRQDVRTTVIAANDGSGRTILGITPDLSATFKGVAVHIGINPDDVGGPSAGLMFTLGIIDKLTPGGLTGGLTVAGTGTIDGFGDVGPIGGIQQKIAAATGHYSGQKVDAAVFLAPASECPDAKLAAPPGLKLVKVDTLATAVAALKAIASGSDNYPHC
jgi:Lon-like protease